MNEKPYKQKRAGKPADPKKKTYSDLKKSENTASHKAQH